MTLDNLGRALAFLRFDDVAAASEGPAPGGGDSIAVFETFDGATVTVTLGKRGEEETWARFDASWDAAAVVETEATEEAAEEDAEAAEEEGPDVEAEIAELVSRTSEWAFLIPGFKAEQLGMRMARLIELPEAEGDDEEAEGTELVPGNAMPPIIQLD